VRYAGRPIRDGLVAYKRVLGYVPEEPFLYPYLTGREYLQLAARLRCLPERAADEKIDALLALFSLYEHRFSTIGSYSKGMKQKVLIAAAAAQPGAARFRRAALGLDVTTALVFHNPIARLARGKMILYSLTCSRWWRRSRRRADPAPRPGGGTIGGAPRAVLASPSLETFSRRWRCRRTRKRRRRGGGHSG
jgi:hypothetical protein